MNLLQHLKRAVTKGCQGDDIELYQLNDGVENWPEVKDETSELTEPLDLENAEIIELTEDKAVIWCGGDWQTPQKVTIEMVDDKPTVTSFEDGGSWRDNTFLDFDQVLEIFEQVP